MTSFSLRFLVASAALFPGLALAEVSVGVVLPLTGPAAGYGAACRNGVTMAMEDFTSQMQGKFKVSIEDDGNSPPNTLSATKSLQQREGTKIFLTWASNTSNAVGALADRGGFDVFAIASDPNVPKGKKNVFSYWVTPDSEIHGLLAKLKRENLKRIAIVTGQHDALISFRNAFDQFAPAEGVTAIYSDEVTTDQTDFRPILNKISKLKDLDGILNNTYVNQTGMLAKQARELGIKLPVFGIEMYEDPAVLDIAEGALEGQFYVGAPDGIGDFIKRYKARFPKDSMMSASNCYDFIGLLSHSPEVTPEGFRSYLETLKDYSGTVGNVSATGDHRFTLPAAVKTIRGREFVPE